MSFHCPHHGTRAGKSALRPQLLNLGLRIRASLVSLGTRGSRIVFQLGLATKVSMLAQRIRSRAIAGTDSVPLETHREGAEQG